MTTLTDKRLAEAGLLKGSEIPGFRTAMSYRAARSPDALPIPDSIAAAPLRIEAFMRGARIAGIWRSMRAKHREIRDPDASEFGRRQENWRIERTSFEHLVEAIATEAGFPDAHSLLARDIGIRVHYGEVQHLRRDVVEFFHADGPNGILSPTHPTLIVHQGQTWTSVEAIYQAQKHADPEVRRTIRLAPDALSAKKASKAFPTTVLTMVDPFGRGKRDAMARAQILRARHDGAFREALAATDGRPIVEIAPDGEPIDSRWGSFGTNVTRGWNTQGRILDEVRSAVVTGTIPHAVPTRTGLT
jgi:predicted NAD-dependent protein-ADP-ribosyltransferase YbiA (DUF1768 family)